ncbi:MAG: zinc-binding protein [Natronospirillum sp.]
MTQLIITTDKQLPLVYSCSGCSNVAQLANNVAVMLDRKGLAEMSCIAGLGGDVPALLKKAQSGRPIVALDGCMLQCARATLARHSIAPDHWVLLTELGLKKRQHQDCSDADVEQVFRHVQTILAVPA